MGMMGCVFFDSDFRGDLFWVGRDPRPDCCFMPMAAGMMIAAPLGGQLTGKVQPRFVIFASTLTASARAFLVSRT